MLAHRRGAASAPTNRVGRGIATARETGQVSGLSRRWTNKRNANSGDVMAASHSKFDALHHETNRRRCQVGIAARPAVVRGSRAARCAAPRAWPARAAPPAAAASPRRRSAPRTGCRSAGRGVPVQRHRHARAARSVEEHGVRGSPAERLAGHLRECDVEQHRERCGAHGSREVRRFRASGGADAQRRCAIVGVSSTSDPGRSAQPPARRAVQQVDRGR